MTYTKHNFSDIPFNDIVRLGQRSLIYNDLFNVSWILHRMCPYKCSGPQEVINPDTGEKSIEIQQYCWPHGRQDEIDFIDLDTVENTISKIKEQARSNGFSGFHFSFSGGEPTAHPKFLEIIDHYSKDVSNCSYLSTHMTTNLMRPISWLEKYVDITKDLHRVSITASWHRNNGRGSLDRIDEHKEIFKDKILFLQENDVHVTINMVMVPLSFDDLWNEALYFHNAGINVTLKPQSDPTASAVVDGYTEDMLEKMRNGLPQKDYTKERMSGLGKVSTRPVASFNRPLNAPVIEYKPIPGMQIELEDSNGEIYYLDQAERMNAFNFNKFKGWKCHAGYQSCVIRVDEVRRSYSCHDQKLGTLENFNLFPEPKTCITPSCVASVCSKMPKYKE